MQCRCCNKLFPGILGGTQQASQAVATIGAGGRRRVSYSIGLSLLVTAGIENGGLGGKPAGCLSVCHVCPTVGRREEFLVSPSALWLAGRCSAPSRRFNNSRAYLDRRVTLSVRFSFCLTDSWTAPSVSFRSCLFTFVHPFSSRFVY